MPVKSRTEPYIKIVRVLDGINQLFNNNILKKLPGTPLLAGLCFLLASISPAAAQVSTLGGAICNAAVNFQSFSLLFQWVAYTAGVACAIQGVYHLRGYTENPQNFPLNRAIMLLVGSACLLALPSAIGAVVTSLYASQEAGGGFGWSCLVDNLGNSSGSGLDVMMSNFINNISGPIVETVSLVAFLCGLYMIIHGLVKASKYGFDPKTHSPSSIIINILFGALLMTIGDNLNMMMTSVFGTSSFSFNVANATSTVMGWTAVQNLSGSTQFGTAIGAALTFFQVIGAIAFVRGWLILKKVAEGGGNVTLAQGITHVLGGVLAINIFVFLQIMDTTFGTGLLAASP